MSKSTASPSFKTDWIEIPGKIDFYAFLSYLKSIAISRGIPYSDIERYDIETLLDIRNHTAAGGGVDPFVKEEKKKGINFNEATPEQIEQIKKMYQRKKKDGE